MPKPLKYTETQFREAVASSTSVHQVLEKLNVSPKGGNYKVFYRYQRRFNVNISHLQNGQSWSKGKKLGPKKSLEDIFSNKFSIGSNKLKHRLLKEKIFTHQCQHCKLTLWQNSLIPLELHHKDGNHENNALHNLELLCPNCHALTENYRGKNIGSQGETRTLKPEGTRS